MVPDSHRQEGSFDEAEASVSAAECVQLKGFKVRIISSND